MKQPAPKPTVIAMVTLDSFVLKDHLRHKIDAVIDFRVSPIQFARLYAAANGRPRLDPILMFKAVVIGQLFGARSERQLVRGIAVNLAYR